VKSLRRQKPSRLVPAVPVAPADTVRELSPAVYELVRLSQPQFFGGVGAHCGDFHQVDAAERNARSFVPELVERKLSPYDKCVLRAPRTSP
jgi:putative phosphoribosyl transferase